MGTIKKVLLDENVSPVPFAGIQGAVSAGGTKYIGPVDNVENATEDIFFIAPCDGTVVSTYAYVITVPGTGETLTITLRKAGSDTTNITTISGSDTTGNSLVQIKVEAGDRLDYKSVATNVAAFGAEDLSLGLGFVPTRRI